MGGDRGALAPSATKPEGDPLWCVDFKGHLRTGNGKPCYPLTVTDSASRLPKAVRSDNREPFASVTAAGGLSQLAVWWTRLGIRVSEPIQV